MGKAERKLGQVYRREVRKHIDGEFLLLKKAIKKRPRWMPRFIWTLGLSFYIKKDIVADL